jgi:hypothetical protein
LANSAELYGFLTAKNGFPVGKKKGYPMGFTTTIGDPVFIFIVSTDPDIQTLNSGSVHFQVYFHRFPIMSDTEKQIDVAQNEFASEAEQIKPTKTLDTLHNDEALKVFANYTGDEAWTEEEEKKLRKKIDWRLMPILCLTYLLQYYDKAMLSQAV